MFGPLGVPELLLIFALVLIVFGPRKIPEIGRTLGKAMAEFRKATDDLKSTIDREVRIEELKTLTPTFESLTTPFESISRSEPVSAGAAPAAGADTTPAEASAERPRPVADAVAAPPDDSTP